jgi:peptidyl-prolyl cis-trans isomerase A (cyclophilin A)
MIQETTMHCARRAFLPILAFAAMGAAGVSLADDRDFPQVVIDTSMGKITVELNHAKAPITVDNFLKYVDKGFYNGTIFHRVISDFMIQGGGFTEQMVEKPTDDPIKLEVGTGLSNTRGTIAMARTNNPNSATAQFFINLFDKNRQLDNLGGGYAVFGKVTDGMAVVDKIAAVETGNRGQHQDVPVKPVTITSVKRVKK